MKRVIWSLILGSAAVAIIWVATLVLDRPGQDRLYPDCLLRPGLYASIFAPDSHFYDVTDSQAGPVSTFIFFTANIATFSGLIYLILALGHGIAQIKARTKS